MITFTTYGTWLQGDERGYVKNGQIRPENKILKESNKKSQLQDVVRLSKTQQKLVRESITREAALQGHKVYALSVHPTHIHIVIAYSPQPIVNIVAYYKKAGRLALRANGYTGKLWTRGYDKRYCFEQSTLNQRIKYVKSHNPA